MSARRALQYGYDLRYLFMFLAKEGLDYQEFRPSDALRLLGFLRRLPSRRPAQRLGLTVIVGGEDGPGRLLSPATVNRILAAVSSFYDWAVIAEETPATPRRCRNVPIPPWLGYPSGISRSWGGAAASSRSAGS
jgi:hypothetical protein